MKARWFEDAKRGSRPCTAAAACARLGGAGAALLLSLVLVATAGRQARADEPQAPASPPPAAGDQSLPSPSAEEKRLYIYGYFSTRLEKTFNEPDFVDGRIEAQRAAAEWTHPSANVMLQNRISDKFKAFLNLNGSGGGSLDVRNMWGEYAPTPQFNIRIGKIYRNFGLYNEILDAVPTYLGIEPPELFDSDHLILSRTTNLMAWGELDAGTGRIRYSLTTDNGEGAPVLGTIPLGGDLRFTSGDDRYVVGTSFYFSNGETTPDIGVGEGSPKSGVLPWMESDRFKVFGGYAQVQSGTWTVQAEYWRAPHQARRNPASVVEVVTNARPNATQLARLLIDPTQPAAESNVAIEADYAVETWYLRTGHSFSSRIGRLEPYAQWDWYRNPESIAKKAYGGDNEAGVADDGAFHKATLGVVLRPVPAVAVKLDGSSHNYRFHGSRVHYEEVRFDVSVIFGQ